MCCAIALRLTRYVSRRNQRGDAEPQRTVLGLASLGVHQLDHSLLVRQQIACAHREHVVPLLVEKRHLDRALFAEAFAHLWPDEGALPSGVELLLARAPISEATKRDVTRRLADVLPAEPRRQPIAPPPPAEVEAEVVAWSDRSTLRTKDFEQMTAAEIREAIGGNLCRCTGYHAIVDAIAAAAEAAIAKGADHG